MMLKIVYGPPPVDAERIEADDLEGGGVLVEGTSISDKLPTNAQCNPKQGVGGQ